MMNMMNMANARKAKKTGVNSGKSNDNPTRNVIFRDRLLSDVICPSKPLINHACVKMYLIT